MKFFLLLLILLSPFHLQAAVTLDVDDIDLPVAKQSGAYLEAYRAFQEKRYAEAEKLAERAVREGTADAYFILGWLHEKGLGRPVDLNTARELYRKGHEKGFAMTSLRYGILLINATGDDQGKLRQQGRQVLAQLNKGPVPLAQLILGKAHAMGYLEDPADFKTAMAHLDYSIEGKNQEAMLYKAALLEGQHNYPNPDLSSSIAFYEQAAKLGNQDAILAAGLRRLNGHESIRDEQKGLAWLEDLAKTGHAAADYHLGLYSINHLKDSKKGFDHLFKSASRKNAQAHLLLGLLFQQGKGTEASEEKAISYYEKATLYGEPRAAHELARLHLSKKDEATREIDLRKGYHFLTQAALKLPSAQTELGILYLSGRLGTKDSTAAFAWFNQAAKAGNAIARNNLAALYETGNGTVQNLNYAFELYSLAAKQGQPSAMTALGRLTALGAGTPKDLSLAWAYLSLAVESKDADANRLLQQLTPQLSGKELSLAKETLESLRKTPAEKK